MAKIDPNFEVYNKLFNEWVEKFGLIKAKEINETTYNNLRKNLMAQISEAIELGETPRQIKNRILEVCEGVYDNMDKVRAMTVARTESGNATNAGSFITARGEGLTYKAWLASKDDRTRTAHADVDGTAIPIDEKFDVGGEPMDFPNDPEASVGNVANCRCTLIYGSSKEELE